MSSFFFSKNIDIYPIFNDQRFNDMLTNDIVSFDQLGPGREANSLDTNQTLCSVGPDIHLHCFILIWIS